MKALALSTALVLLLSACGLNDPKSSAGFRLPDGNAEAGRQAFVALRCFNCHLVDGVTETPSGTPAARVKLGGEVSRVKNYGDLVTSIINPSHRIAAGEDIEQVAPAGKSLMELAALNSKVTVQQLIDLVAFLQSKYQMVPPVYDPYSYVYAY
jgi:sulfur-oxidizing protein SoxX